MPEVVPPLGEESIPPPWVRASTGGFTAKLLKTPRGVLQTQTEGKQLPSLLWDRERTVITLTVITLLSAVGKLWQRDGL